jgi:mono/diheme cytochrome c family protein
MNSAGTTSGGTHDNANLPPGDAARGKTLTVQNSCPECHGADFSGSSFFANITSDAQTGIGAWTDAQVAAALRDGVEADGSTMCSLMERFPFSDQQTADVIAYLRSLPAVSRSSTDVCPGHGPRSK